MSVHKFIFALHKSLGYSKEEESNAGRCYGYANRLLEAALLGEIEEQRFRRRINHIISTPTEIVVQSIKAAKNKLGRQLTLDDLFYLEILTFHENLELFHSPNLYKEL